MERLHSDPENMQNPLCGEKRLAQQPEKTKRKHLKKSSQLRAGTGAALTDG